MRTLMLTVPALAALVACTDPTGARHDQFGCQTQTDCAAGFECRGSVCQIPGSGGGGGGEATGGGVASGGGGEAAGGGEVAGGAGGSGGATGGGGAAGGAGGASASAYTILKAATAPTLDGTLSEYAQVPSITFGTPQTDGTVTVQAVWDATALYLAYRVADTKLNATTVSRDGPVWADDAVEWFLATTNDMGGDAQPGSPYMLPEDFQGIVNALNSQFDCRGGSTPQQPDATASFTWQSAVSVSGTVGSNTDFDTGYTVEVKIPWSSLGLTAPANGTPMRLGLAVDDDDGATQASVMWPNTTNSFQNASKWQGVTLSGTTVQLGTQTADTAAPAATTNLAAGSPTTTTVALTWTAPGDDGTTGSASSYDVRYSTSTITAASWATAIPVSGEPTPGPAGTSQTLTVSGLMPATTYYFALKTSDEVPNASALSNVASATTTMSTGAPTPPADATAGAAANTMLAWGGAEMIYQSDTQLDTWHSRGFGGYVAGFGFPYGFGGDQKIQGSSTLALTGNQYQRQQRMESNTFTTKLHARNMKAYLSQYVQSYYGPSGTFVFTAPDGTTNALFDTTYRAQVVASFADWAAGAKFLGFDGLAFDMEPYANRTWSWNHAGNTHTQAQTKAAAFAFGQAIGNAFKTSFPNYELVIYGAYQPESWSGLVQQIINGAPADNPSQELYLDFLDGIYSAGGHSEIRYLDAIFYKTTHLNGSNWNTANKYNVNRWFAWASRNLQSWQTSAPKLNTSPFAWIDEDVASEGNFTADRGEPYVANQLAAFRKWGMGGVMADYLYHGFDYTVNAAGAYQSGGPNDGYVYAGANAPGGHLAGMQAAAMPGTVDTTAPTLSNVVTTRSGNTVTITARASHALGIRNVNAYVHPAATAKVYATMTWNPGGGSYSTNYDAAYQECSLTLTAAPGTFVVLTAVSIKNQTHSIVLPL